MRSRDQQGKLAFLEWISEPIARQKDMIFEVKWVSWIAFCFNVTNFLRPVNQNASKNAPSRKGTAGRAGPGRVGRFNGPCFQRILSKVKNKSAWRRIDLFFWTFFRQKPTSFCIQFSKSIFFKVSPWKTWLFFLYFLVDPIFWLFFRQESTSFLQTMHSNSIFSLIAMEN